MNEFNFNNLLNSLLGLRHISQEIRQLVEPSGVLDRLASALPLSLRWRRSKWFSEMAKRFGEHLDKSPSPARAAELELEILLRAVVKQAQRLPVSQDWVAQAERVERSVNLSSPAAINTTLTRVAELHAHLIGEITLGRFYVVPVHYAGLMADDSRPFGDKVHARFKDARQDIAASGRCLALDEWTACVFHSMRALEHGLRAFAHYVGLPMATGIEIEQWKNIIDQIEKKIREMEKLPRDAAKIATLQFCSEAASQFRYFKDAWRNHVSHSRVSYDPREAYSIWNHTREFMESLSEHLFASGFNP